MDDWTSESVYPWNQEGVGPLIDFDYDFDLCSCSDIHEIPLNGYECEHKNEG